MDSLYCHDPTPNIYTVISHLDKKFKRKQKKEEEVKENRSTADLYGLWNFSISNIEPMFRWKTKAQQIFMGCGSSAN